MICYLPVTYRRERRGIIGVFSAFFALPGVGRDNKKFPANKPKTACPRGFFSFRVNYHPDNYNGDSSMFILVDQVHDELERQLR